MAIITPMTDTTDTLSLVRLLTWLSPAFPIGAFAYSGGLERAVADGLVSDAASLEIWIASAIAAGAGWNDAVLLVQAHRDHEDEAALFGLAELAAALAGSRERHAETLSLGAAFIEAASAWPHAVFSRLPSPVAYPVAVGSIAGAHGVAPVPVLAGYLHAYASQLASAGIRLSVIGQSGAVGLLARLEERIGATAERAARAGVDDLGSATVMAEIETLRHEVQTTRLFRS